MKFKIFTDSIANLTDDMIEQGDIGILSYIIELEGREFPAYEKGAYTRAAINFYEEMEKGAYPKSSLISCERITEACEPYLKEGRDVLFITCSAGISGTYAQGLLAAKELNKKYSSQMFVVDSVNASLGEGLLAVQAAKLRDMGQDIHYVVKWLENSRWEMNSVFTCNDIKYLRRSGRISAAVAVAGTLLNIKPILIADGNGKIAQKANVHTRRKAMTKILEEVAALCDGIDRQTIAIAHCNCLADAETLKEGIMALGARDVVLQLYDMCSGTHLGPGGLAVFFMGKDRRKTLPQEIMQKSGCLAKTKTIQ